MGHNFAALFALLAGANALTIGAEVEAEDLNVYYDYEGDDKSYAVHLETGMYGEGSEFAYEGDIDIHLDGTCEDCKSKKFYGIPDEPPEEEGVTWRDPYQFDLTGLFTTEAWNDRFPMGPGWLAHLTDDDESSFADHVAHYAAHLLGVEEDYFYTPFEEYEYDEDMATRDNIMLCTPRANVCSPQCPTAVFREETGKIDFSWLAVTDDCIHEPTSTIILLTPWSKEEGFPDDIINKQKAAEFEGSSMPHFPVPMSVDPFYLFEEMHQTHFKLDTVYFVTALYKTKNEHGDLFELPETSMQPLILTLSSE